MSEQLAVRIHPRLSEIPAADWNTLLADANPFLDHAFLSGLEEYGCLDAAHGWRGHHLGLYDNGKLVAAAPLYLKTNSHGEFVFDWSWAHAYARNGLDYYPKLLCAVPYSPVTGPRLLGDPSRRTALIDTIRDECDRLGLSSAHANFCSDADAAAFADHAQWLPRFDWQFHWQNKPIASGGCRDFDDFLDALKPKKRKNIRQERAHVQRAGVRCEVRHGGEIEAETWRRIHLFYSATFDEKGNYPALTLEFFQHLGRTMPDRVLAVLACRGTDLIAAALLLRSPTTLYGRYWGCAETIPGLHFEVCYYQGIDYCMRHGLQRFEPGAQGEHKLARGFLPARTTSFHYVADRRFRAAIADALARESQALHAYHGELFAHSPYAETT